MSESVTLDQYSLRRIAELMPPPTACFAGAVAARVDHARGQLAADLADVSRQLAHLSAQIANPRACAARELYLRGCRGASAGWHGEAEADLREALTLTPSAPRMHLALAYVRLSNEQSQADADPSWETALLAAIRYGAALEPDVAARAALVLAEELTRRGRSSDATDLLRDVADRIDSVEVALEAACLAEDKELQTALLQRAPILVGARLGLAPANIDAVEFASWLRAALDAADAAGIDRSDLPLPQAGEPITQAAIDELVHLLRERAQTRVLDDRNLAERSATARAQRDHATRELLELEQRQPTAAERAAHAARDRDARLALNAANRILNALSVETHEQQQQMHEREQQLARLEQAVRKLSEVRRRADDIGIEPIAPGIDGLVR